jgi:hypothetical protein
MQLSDASAKLNPDFYKPQHNKDAPKLLFYAERILLTVYKYSMFRV